MTLLLLLLLGGAQPGEVIEMYATATYEDHAGRTYEAYPAHVELIVVHPTLQAELARYGVEAVFAPGATRRWESAPGVWRVWHDPCLPGLREVRIIGRRSVEGIVTKGGGLWVCTPRDVSAPASTGAGVFSRVLGPFVPERQSLPPITLLEEVTR